MPLKIAMPKLEEKNLFMKEIAKKNLGGIWEKG